jgi:site-specific recombinase XerD
VTLAKAIEVYLDLKRGMGNRFVTEGEILASFSRKIGPVRLSRVTPAVVKEFLYGGRPVTRFWHRKFEVLQRFYRFAVTRSYVASAPLPTIIPKEPEPCPPYIYTPDEIRRLLKSAAIVDRVPERGGRYSYSSSTYRVLLLSLYGAALRHSEGLGLTMRDVDLEASVITVRESKFFKTRFVPIGPRLTRTLAKYASARRRGQLPLGEDSAFFATHAGHSIKRKSSEVCFRNIRKRAGVRRGNTRRGPGLHDLRHSAAVHRLVAWYREGKNVQQLLPLLSTYLGHERLNSTQVYLTMTPELLSEANRRFERYAVLGAIRG